ncbi:HD-GYP domain-containing protein [Geopsychrobacter electrodiphilus]|uniref:HD-GYP domain-containing protein n=1 Tax=Geopsychrobacter electrodiphilus TaxID=225196 RepID=UPI00035D7B33|nr:HD domain-containing phosphohydrolase [Geopsychrobacter electrodiphilus]
MKTVLGRQAIQETLRLLSSALAASSLYSPEHKQVQSLVPQILESLHRLLDQQSELTFLFVKNDLLFDGKPLDRTPYTERISRLFYGRNIGFIRLQQGIESREVELLLRVAIGLEKVENLSVLTPNIDYGAVETQNDLDDVLPITGFELLTDEELKSISDFYDVIADKDNLDIRKVSSIIAGFVTAFQQEANPLLALVPLRMEDEYTFTHSINVSILNLAQGTSLGLQEQLLHDVGIAGMLHDAGKIFIDNEIIRKPSSLVDAEWEQMIQHPIRGAQYLMNQEGIPQIAICTAFEHHMRYDKTGYPTVPKNWKLSLCSEMTMISDTFDALRTRRAYKEPWDFPKISGLMLELAGTRLNPYLVLNFLKILEELGERVIEDGINLSADAPALSEAQLATRHVCE